MTKEMRKKYALVAELAGRLRRPAGGKDIVCLHDVIDELDGILRDIQLDVQNSSPDTIERRLFAAMTRKAPDVSGQGRGEVKISFVLSQNPYLKGRYHQPGNPAL